MSYCKDCRWKTTWAAGLTPVCRNPAVRLYHAGPVDGVPDDVACTLEREPYRPSPQQPCGRAGLLFEQRDPSPVYRFFRWLFGGDGNGRKGREA